MLVLAPTGRDVEVTCDVLRRGGVECEPCTDLDETLRELGQGAAAVLLVDDVLTPNSLEQLGAALEQQEPWSDVPLLIATTSAGSLSAHARIRPHLARAGSITILERPIPTTTLLTAVRSALSARRRQYELRRLVAELRQETQKLEVEREVRERFVAILAHDLRGPLSVIRLGLDLLVQEGVPSAQRHALARRTTQNLLQMDRMLHDLLDVHRIHAGRPLPLRLAPCDLTDVARQVAGELNAVGHGGRFMCHCEERVEGIWSAEDLRRSLWNLGINARKYGAPDRPIELVVGADEEGAWVSVHNEGLPISPEDQATLFEPFRRTRGSEAGQERGWGLGLTFVRGCAESHGGTVRVQSSSRRGTTFTIRLPWDARPYQPRDEPCASDRRDGPPVH